MKECSVILDVNEAKEYKKICKDELDYRIISLRLGGLSVNEIADRLKCNKSTVSRRLRELKARGFEDPFDIVKDAKRESLKIGRIGETAVAYALERIGINYEWTGKEIGNNPDYILCGRKVSVWEMKNYREGAIFTKAEVIRDVIPRFKGYDNEIKVLLITRGVRINNDARKLLKENNIKIVRFGDQIRDLEALTLWRLYFRIRRIKGLFKGLFCDGLSSGDSYLIISDDLFELLIIIHWTIGKCKGGVKREGG